MADVARGLVRIAWKRGHKGLESTGYLGVVTREPWVDKFNMYTNKSLSRLERFESKLGSEFVCFFDFQLLFAHPCSLIIFILFLVRFVGFLWFLWLLGWRLLRWFWSRLGSVTPTMWRSWARAWPWMATMRWSTTTSVSTSSMRWSTGDKKRKQKLLTDFLHNLKNPQIKMHSRTTDVQCRFA